MKRGKNRPFISKLPVDLQKFSEKLFVSAEQCISSEILYTLRMEQKSMFLMMLEAAQFSLEAIIRGRIRKLKMQNVFGLMKKR